MKLGRLSDICKLTGPIKIDMAQSYVFRFYNLNWQQLQKTKENGKGLHNTPPTQFY